MKKLVFAVVISSLFAGPFWAQTISMPQMPSMLDMPEITAPSVGGGFYRPQVPGYYPGNTGNNGKKATATDNTSDNGGSVQAKSSSSATASTLNLLTSALYGGDFLTASDLNGLTDTGTLSALSGLGNLTTLSTGTDVSQVAVLSQILESINELKEGQKKLENTRAVEVKADGTSSILRFKINGYDMTSGLTDVYFSKPENDGSFLLTLDRTYIADRKNYNETAYLLFRANGTQGAALTYTVETSLSQNIENPNSLVYRMCSGGNLKAVKTGNLVVLNGNQSGVTLDLLLDIGK